MLMKATEIANKIKNELPLGAFSNSIGKSPNTDGLPTSATISITERCNLKCSFCSIWEIEDPKDLDLALLKKLPTTLRTVTLTGGETMLRRDLPQIVQTLTDLIPGIRIIIITNGSAHTVMKKRALELMAINPNLAFRVSIDGKEELHDELRGVTDSYKKAWWTIEAIKEAGVTDIGISFTLSDANSSELIPIYEEGRAKDIDFVCSVVQNSDLYYNKADNVVKNAGPLEAAIQELNHRELRRFSPKSWFRAYFNDGLIDFMHGERKLDTCDAVRDFIFLDPHGDVYPCNILPVKVGNLNDVDKYEDLLKTKQYGIALATAKSCTDCWTSCNVQEAIRRKPWEPVRWLSERVAGKLL